MPLPVILAGLAAKAALRAMDAYHQGHMGRLSTPQDGADYSDLPVSNLSDRPNDGIPDYLRNISGDWPVSNLSDRPFSGGGSISGSEPPPDLGNGSGVDRYDFNPANQQDVTGLSNGLDQYQGEGTDPYFFAGTGNNGNDWWSQPYQTAPSDPTYAQGTPDFQQGSPANEYVTGGPSDWWSAGSAPGGNDWWSQQSDFSTVPSNPGYAGGGAAANDYATGNFPDTSNLNDLWRQQSDFQVAPGDPSYMQQGGVVGSGSSEFPQQSDQSLSQPDQSGGLQQSQIPDFGNVPMGNLSDRPADSPTIVNGVWSDANVGSPYPSIMGVEPPTPSVSAWNFDPGTMAGSHIPLGGAGGGIADFGHPIGYRML